MIVSSFPAVTETFIINQVTGLLKEGVDVDIYSHYKPDASIRCHSKVEEYKLLNRTVYFNSMPESKITRINNIAKLVIEFKSIPGIKKILRACNVFRYGKSAASLYLTHVLYLLHAVPKYDIIHCQFGSVARFFLPFMDIGAFEGRLVISFRGYDATVDLQRNKEIYKRLFDIGELFLPVSNSIRNTLIENGCRDDKIKVLYSGIDVADFNPSNLPAPQDGVVHVATVGRLTGKKGIIYGLRAVQKVLQAGYGMRYTIVGEGMLRPELEDFIAQNNLSEYVVLAGWKSNAEVLDLLKNIHILIAPSITTDDGDQEGIPNILKEAMAMGKPVIATDHSGIPELVEDGTSGFIVPERDVGALADRLVYLINHPEKWPDFGQAGRARIENDYDINKLSRRLVSYYDEVLSK